MSPEIPVRRAELGMYPFDSVRWAWDALWAAIRDRAPGCPVELTWSGDIEASWHDTDCVVTHMCGWPFATRHHGDMRLVGAFDLDLPEAEPGGRYRPVLLSRIDRTLDELVSPTTCAVANSADSLSGWLSLVAATVGPGGRWPGTVAFTTSHLESVRALAAGAGDLTSVDSWSLAFIADEEPETLADLHRVGTGPLVPTPAVVARTSLDEAVIVELRQAFADAVSDPALASALAALHIRGGAQHTLDDYLAIVPLVAER